MSWVYALKVHVQPVVNGLRADGNVWNNIDHFAPFTIVTGRDNSLSGQGNDRADLVGDPNNLPGGRSRGDQVLSSLTQRRLFPTRLGNLAM
jgi:hypothetical protein